MAPDSAVFSDSAALMNTPDPANRCATGHSNAFCRGHASVVPSRRRAILPLGEETKTRTLEATFR
jgi:hypothetical protein